MSNSENATKEEQKQTYVEQKNISNTIIEKFTEKINGDLDFKEVSGKLSSLIKERKGNKEIIEKLFLGDE